MARATTAGKLCCYHAHASSIIILQNVHPPLHVCVCVCVCVCSLAMSSLSVATTSSVPAFLIGGTLANDEPPCWSMNLAAFHILSLSPRNSSQCTFRCRRIVRWKSLFARVAISRSSASSRPWRLVALALFLQYVYDFLSAVRSSFHHLFIYGDGFAHGQCACRAPSTQLVSLLAMSSTSSLGNPASFCCSTA